MWYLTLHRYVNSREEARAFIDEHLEWNYRQHQAGTILFSGPTSDRRFAIMVVKADSLEAAVRLMDDEPFVRRGYRTYEIYEWDIHQILGVGSFRKSQ